MDLALFRQLLGPVGQSALTQAVELRPSPQSLLACIDRLRRRFPTDLAAVALDMAILRQRAVAKFSRAQSMYFTREALEQSSGEIIATYRAERFASFSRIADLCCGVGGDAIGLAERTAVVAVDNDPVRLAMAEQNVKAYDRTAKFVEGDVTQWLPADDDAVFIDPDRRADGKRHIKIAEYVPAVAPLVQRLGKSRPIGIKVAPGAPWAELQAFDAEAEMISVDGELKECVLWFGPLRTARRRATVLPSRATFTADTPTDPPEPVAPRAYLFEPDAALIRSGLVTNLANQIGADVIDNEIAYLTADRPIDSPFAREFRVVDWAPFHGRRVGEILRSLGAGPVTITKRGSAVDVNELLRSWKLKGDRVLIVHLTRSCGDPIAIITEPATIR